MQEYNNNPQGDGSDKDSGNNSNGNNGNGNNRDRGPNIMAFIVVTLIALLLISYFVGRGNSQNEELAYNDFVRMVSQNQVKSVVIDGDRILIESRGKGNNEFSGQTYVTGLAEDVTTVTGRLLNAGVEVKSTVEDGRSVILSLLLTYVLPIALLWFFMGFLFRRMDRSGGGIFGVGKTTAKMYGGKETGVTFKDVAGEDEAKESLVEIVDFLHNPGKYSKIGAKIPKGALLVGPPGTGKTLLAKAVAGEAGVPFFSMAGSDFVELYVGVGASRVRDLFKEAEKSAPCIIFIDEIDAIGRSRDSKYGGGNDEREQTLNQLLSEMDGFDARKGIILLAATNRPEILDKALLRPGRFDRRIIVEEPDLKGRVEILKVHSKDVLMDQTVNLDEIGLATVGAVGADLANMINEAAILAVKHGREYVSQKDLLDAVELVSVGKEKKDRVLSRQERRIVSYHETGHALISALMKNTEPVQKITIIPRTMGTLGYVLSYPEEEKFMQTEKELRSELVSLLGGRAAEDIVFDTVTTGAANDIEKATRIARAMVTRFGMSARFGMMGLETVQDEYLNRNVVSNCADETAAAIDEEVKALIANAYAEAKRLLTENREILNKIADYLCEKETISGREFMEIYCREKGLPLPVKEAGSDKAAVIGGEGESEDVAYTEDGKEIISVTRGRNTRGYKPNLSDPEVAAKAASGPVIQPGAPQSAGNPAGVSGMPAYGTGGSVTNSAAPAPDGNATNAAPEPVWDGNATGAVSGAVRDGAIPADVPPANSGEHNGTPEGREGGADGSFADEFKKRVYKSPEDKNE
ncbi:MAG: ATP-dependent zinc metalloprotease FtsH [Lachnospiraceae bacterium]|nr:ATP-dependent zinc metalloprotease FtsH [Lachnospiraceae bacterium]